MRLIFFFILFCSNLEAQNYLDIHYYANEIPVMSGDCNSELRTIKFDAPRKISLIAFDECTGNGMKYKYILVSVDGQDRKTFLDQVEFNFSNTDIKKYFKALDKSNSLHDYASSTRVLASIYMDSLEQERSRKMKIIQDRIDEENRIIEQERMRKQATEDSLHQLNIDSIYIADLVLFAVRNDTLEALSQREEKLKTEIANLVIAKAEQNGGILIDKFRVFEKYGTSIEFRILNLSANRIKYINFYVQAYNSVNDKVGTIEELTGIGFIEPNETGEWIFEDVWFQDYIHSAKVVSVQVEFENGKKTTINDPSKIIIRKEDSDLLEGGTEFTYETFGAISVRKYSDQQHTVHLTFLSMDAIPMSIGLSLSEVKEAIESIDRCIKAHASNEAHSGDYFSHNKYSNLFQFRVGEGITYLTKQELELIRIAFASRLN